MARKATLGKTRQVNWRFPIEFLEDDFDPYYGQYKSKRNFIDPRDASLYLMKLGLEVENYRFEEAKKNKQ